MRQANTVAGYRGLRGDILVALKKHQPQTAPELAKRFSVTPNALRRHLKVLEEDRLVSFRREIRGVGGPVFAFMLSEKGEALFPRAYVAALTGALDAVRAEHGSEGVVQLFRKQWSALAEGAQPMLASLPPAERTQLLAELLTSQGYMAEAEETSPTESRIREHNCAMQAVAEQFPEICAAEERFLSDMLGGQVERQSHIMNGCTVCEYSVRFPAPAGDASRPSHTPRAARGKKK